MSYFEDTLHFGEYLHMYVWLYGKMHFLNFFLLAFLMLESPLYGLESHHAFSVIHT